MPLLLLRNNYIKNIDSLVHVTCADKQRLVFKRKYATWLQVPCQNYDCLQDFESGYWRDSKTGEKIALTNLTELQVKYIRNRLTQVPMAKHVISIIAPIYIDGKHGEAALLRSCYLDALNLAKNHGSKNITIPLISSKVYGYPCEEAYTIAISAIKDWLTTNDMDVSLLIFDKKTCLPPKILLRNINNFIDNHYEFRANPKYKGLYGRLQAYTDRTEAEETGKSQLSLSGSYIKLIDRYTPSDQVFFSGPGGREIYEEKLRKLREELGEKLDDSFSVALLELINIKAKTAVEVYKQANIDRKLFSKIRNECYIPGKRTTIALAVALELSLDETNDLLKRAGYTLSRSLLFDVIIKYFISNGNYDIFEINNTLFSYDQPLLGG